MVGCTSTHVEQHTEQWIQTEERFLASFPLNPLFASEEVPLCGLCPSLGQDVQEEGKTWEDQLDAHQEQLEKEMQEARRMVFRLQVLSWWWRQDTNCIKVLCSMQWQFTGTSYCFYWTIVSAAAETIQVIVQYLKIDVWCTEIAIPAYHAQKKCYVQTERDVCVKIDWSGLFAFLASKSEFVAW